jgi:hypothetical protein
MSVADIRSELAVDGKSRVEAIFLVATSKEV